MLFAIGIGLLVVWAIAVAGPFALGEIVHGVLLVGLLLLLIAFAKARDAAAAEEQRARKRSGDTPAP